MMKKMKIVIRKKKEANQWNQKDSREIDSHPALKMEKCNPVLIPAVQLLLLLPVVSSSFFSRSRVEIQGEVSTD